MAKSCSLFAVLSFVAITQIILGFEAKAIEPDQNRCATVQKRATTSGTINGLISVKNSITYAGLDGINEVLNGQGDMGACTFKIAKMVNKFGSTVSPTSDSTQAAVRSNAAILRSSPHCPGFGLCAEISDAGDSDVWPISTLTYFVIGLNNTDEIHNCERMRAVYAYTKWILTSKEASKIASDLFFASMPPSVSDGALQILDQMKCTKNNVSHFVKDLPLGTTDIAGSGSSLQKGLQTKLTNEYFVKTSLKVAYSSVGSGSGKKDFIGLKTDFAGSDSVIDMKNAEVISRQQRMIPVFAAAVGIVYNNRFVDDLVLSRKAVNSLWTAAITSWANPEIISWNPGAAWPGEAIIRIVREDSSGTTEALTTALYKFAELPEPADYKLHLLEGSSNPNWPVATVPFADGAVCNLANCTKVLCSSGFFLDSEQDKCTQCPAGKYFPSRGQQTECLNCALGTYSNTMANTKCTPCDEFSYQDAEGQSSCIRCPQHSRRFFVEREVTQGNSTVVVKEKTTGSNADQCKCEANYFLPETVGNRTLGGLPCLKCPDGGTCDGFNGRVQTIPRTKINYWGDPQHPTQFFECLPGFCEENYECSAGHSGRLCTSTDTDYFTLGDNWYFKCPSLWSERWIMTVFGLAFIVTIQVIINTLSSSQYDAFASLMIFLQITGLISKLNLRWHPSLNYVNIIMSVVNFDVDFFGPHCALTSWNRATVFFVQLALPGMIAVGLAIKWLVHEFRYPPNLKSDESPLLCRKNLDKRVLCWATHRQDKLASFVYKQTSAFILMMYHTLAFRAFSVFVCTLEPDLKTQFMTAAPEIECWKGRHIGMVVVSVIYIPLVIIGFPLHFTRELIKGYRQDLLLDGRFMELYGFLYCKYEVKSPWWEMVVILRRLLLVLIVVFVERPMVQGALSVVMIYIMLTLHLSIQPFRNSKVRDLEVFGMCCSMAYATCGMLFYPSLDSSIECVGSSQALDASDCTGNMFVKNVLSRVMLVLICLTILGSIYITYMDFEELSMSSAAATKIDFDKQWFGKDKSLKLGSRNHSNFASRRGSRSQNSLDDDEIQVVKSSSQVRAASSDPNDVNIQRAKTQMMQLHQQASAKILNAGPAGFIGLSFFNTFKPFKFMKPDGTEIVAFSDPFALNLCDMLNGYYLHDWHKSLSALSQKEFAVRMMYGKEDSNSMRQEQAYIDLERVLPRFSADEDVKSGYWSRSEYSRALNRVTCHLPAIIDFITIADADAVKGFADFLKSYSEYRKVDKVSAVHKLIQGEHRGPIAHFLMQTDISCTSQCSSKERELFREMAGGIVAAAGLDKPSLFKVVLNRGVTAFSGVEVKRRLSRAGSRLGSFSLRADSIDVQLAPGGKPATVDPVLEIQEAENGTNQKPESNSVLMTIAYP